jgi:hypothetical protein
VKSRVSQTFSAVGTLGAPHLNSSTPSRDSSLFRRGKGRRDSSLGDGRVGQRQRGGCQDRRKEESDVQLHTVVIPVFIQLKDEGDLCA